MEILLFFLATIVAAAINALAGGGGLITFSLLLLVMHPVAADATSAIALVTGYPAAGWRTRNELTEAIRTWWLLLIPSVLGGLAVRCCSRGPAIEICLSSCRGSF